jgi:hypothetical protein
MILSSRTFFIDDFDQSCLRDAVAVYRQIVTKFQLLPVTSHWKFKLTSKSCVYDQESPCESNPFFVARLPVNKLLER